MNEATAPRDAETKALTERLKDSRTAVREPGATLVPDTAGGDPIPWETDDLDQGNEAP
jgi:hypothetical protein